MSNMIKVECPCCHATLWVDTESQTVAEYKKTKKKNVASFDELLVNEKTKKEKVDERFIMAKELEKEKKKRAEDFFSKSLKEK